MTLHATMLRTVTNAAEFEVTSQSLFCAEIIAPEPQTGTRDKDTYAGLTKPTHI
jgi:hypothetical protein